MGSQKRQRQRADGDDLVARARDLAGAGNRVEDQLRAVQDLRQALDLREFVLWERARADGRSWSELAKVYGVTKSAAAQKYAAMKRRHVLPFDTGKAGSTD